MRTHVKYMEKWYDITSEKSFDSITIIKKRIEEQLQYLQIRDVLAIKFIFNVDYINVTTEERYVLCKVHSIKYRLGNGSINTIMIDKQNCYHILRILRKIASKVQNDFYKEYLYEKISKIIIKKEVLW